MWWLIDRRQGFPLDIDEAGYMTIALRDHAALVHGGLGSYWHAIESQYPFAPLVPAATALVYLIRTSILASFAAELGCALVLAAATYGVARRLVGARLATFAALVTVTAPGAINFSREYLFALPSVALEMCALYALVRSEGLVRRRWAVALGVGLGLMLLARTMTIAIVPAFLLAGAVRVWALDRDRVRATGHFLLAVGICFGLAAVWYLPNLTPVFRYLTNYGYGARSGRYGSAHSILSWGWWSRELQKIVAEDLYVPLGIAVIAGAAVALAQRLRKSVRAGWAAELRELAGRDVTTVALVLAGSYVALSSSRNEGAGFALMLMPPLLLLAVLPLRTAGRYAAPVIAIVAAVAVLNVFVSTDVWHGLSRPRSVDLPLLGTAPVLKGEAHSLEAIRIQLPGDPVQFVPSERRWPDAARLAAGWLISYAHARGRTPITAFGMRNRVFNTNSVALAALLYYDTAIPMAQLDPLLAGDRRAAYARYLDDPLYGEPNLLLTTSSTAGDFPPLVTQAKAIAAARADGFMPVGHLTLPDGRVVTIWWIQRGPVYGPR